MKRNFTKLFAEIEQKERELTLARDKVIGESLMMTSFLNERLQELKSEVLRTGFDDEKEEIHFFRNIKPKVQGKLFYYNKIYRVETLRPVSMGNISKKYYLEEEKQLRKKYKYFLKASDFHRYYQSGNTSLDRKYFLRYQFTIEDGLENHVFELDNDFSTYYDYLVARIICEELFFEYLLLRTCDDKEEMFSEYTATMEWTSDKRSLIELIYALYSNDCLTDGNISITKISMIFQTLFKIQLGNIHHAFYKMKSRSGSRTKFIDQLKESLETYMDTAE